MELPQQEGTRLSSASLLVMGRWGSCVRVIAGHRPTPLFSLDPLSVALPFPSAPAAAFLAGALGTSVGMRGLCPPPRDWVGSPESQPDGPSSRGFNWEK